VFAKKKNAKTDILFGVNGEKGFGRGHQKSLVN
jgi:hypothetical protein